MSISTYIECAQCKGECRRTVYPYDKVIKDSCPERGFKATYDDADTPVGSRRKDEGSATEGLE